MANTLDMYAHLANQVVRTGWYTGLARITGKIISRLDRLEGEPITEVKSEWSNNRSSKNQGLSSRKFLQDLLSFMLADARLVYQGIVPPIEDQVEDLPERIKRLRYMLTDLPRSNRRRRNYDGQEVARSEGGRDLPAYFVQNFHYQTGGYLTDESAELYDMQVETLFLGTANAMRRQALKPIAEFIQGKDQRQLRLADIACGTGRFLGQLRQAFPSLPVSGVDLSGPYLREAARHLKSRRWIKLVEANAEQLPFTNESHDMLTCIYLFHELPSKVRHRVAKEMARVLKPGGILVFIDSLQLGDKPGYDGMLKAFPDRFHEPYYMNYIQDDLAAIFSEQRLLPSATWNAFLSKIIVCEKTG